MPAATARERAPASAPTPARPARCVATAAHDATPTATANDRERSRADFPERKRCMRVSAPITPTPSSLVGAAASPLPRTSPAPPADTHATRVPALRPAIGASPSSRERAATAATRRARSRYAGVNGAPANATSYSHSNAERRHAR
ncbi:hypothetical protein [Lysobacter enzymogenes]|uniref:hypothetical protein n=1 Tax=Lysobacter enzymogenes TaxID=69 RepID=UPI000F4B9EA8|nr:hypothetical protein [Lysobacter enzymogenes]